MCPKTQANTSHECWHSLYGLEACCHYPSQPALPPLHCFPSSPTQQSHLTSCWQNQTQPSCTVLVLPPVDSYERLILSSLFFPLKGLIPIISPSIISNRHCLSPKTSIFFPIFFSETSGNTSSYLPHNTLHLCLIWVPKPSLIRADEHKGSYRHYSICDTEQKSHLFKSDIGTKSIAINLGSPWRCPDVLFRINPEICASFLTFKKNVLKYQQAWSVTSNFSFNLCIAALENKKTVIQVTGVTLMTGSAGIIEARGCENGHLSPTPNCFLESHSGVIYRVERTLQLLASCSCPHWTSLLFCLSFLSSLIRCFSHPPTWHHQTWIQILPVPLTRCVTWGVPGSWASVFLSLKWESWRYQSHKVMMRTRCLHKFRRQWVCVTLLVRTGENKHSTTVSSGFLLLCVFHLC